MIIAIKAKQPNIIQKKFNCQYFLGKSLLFFKHFLAIFFILICIQKTVSQQKITKIYNIIAKKSQPSVIKQTSIYQS